MTITDSSTTRYQLGAWDLSDLLPDAADERVAGLLRSIEQRVAELESKRASLDTITAPELLEIVRLYEAVTEEMTVLGAYASLRFSADTQDESGDRAAQPRQSRAHGARQPHPLLHAVVEGPARGARARRSLPIPRPIPTPRSSCSISGG